MSILKKVQRGSDLVIPASTYNQFVDAATKVNFPDRKPTLDTPKVTLLAGQVWGRITESLSWNKFHIIGYGSRIPFEPGPSPSDFEDRVVFDFESPDPRDTSDFCILAEAGTLGSVVRAHAFGVTPVKVRMTNASHNFARMSTVLNFATIRDALDSSDSGPAKILWREPGLGEKWAIVNLQGISGGSGEAVPVNLAFSGGQNGTELVPASWTYHVTLADGSGFRILTHANPGASPHKWKRTIGVIEIADFGFAIMNSSGQWILTWVNEIYTHRKCDI